MGDPKMLFYDAEGNRVADENDPRVRWQYLSDDPARPDAPKSKRSGVVESRATTEAEPVTVIPEAEPVVEATKVPATEEKAQSEPTENKARKSSANK